MASNAPNAQQVLLQRESRGEENVRRQPLNRDIMHPCSCGLSTGIVAGAILTGIFFYLLPSQLFVPPAADIGFPATCSTTTARSFTSLPGDNVCFTKTCSSMSRVLRKFINQYADPCNDFYEYVCGGYEVYSGDLLTVLERQFNESVVTTMNTTTVPPSGQSAIQKAVGLLRACYRSRERQLRDATELVDFMKDHNISIHSNDGSDPMHHVFMLSLYYDVHIIFKVQVSANTLNSKERRLIVVAYNGDHLQWLDAKAARDDEWRRKYYEDHMSVLGINDATSLEFRIEVVERKVHDALKEINWPDVVKEMTVREMGLPTFTSRRWLELMQTYVQDNYTDEDTVNVSAKALAYLNITTLYLDSEDLNLLVAWEVIGQLGVFFYSDATTVPWDAYEHLCYSRVRDVIDLDAAYFLHSLTRWTLAAARNLTSDVRNELLARAMRATHLPDQDEALKNITALRIIVAFPEEFSTTAKLDALWDEFPDIGDRFLLIWLQLRRKRVLWQLEHPDHYVFPATPVRTSYDSDRRILAVPPSMLTDYFFGVDSLASLNFAGLGHFVATGMARSVRTEAENNCPAEGVRELVGLRAAYSAYMRATAQDYSRLPQMSIRSRRLFFVAACLKTCAVRRPTGPHNSETCNELVRNMVDFAKAFRCGVGSSMNPKKKCEAW